MLRLTVRALALFALFALVLPLALGARLLAATGSERVALRFAAGTQRLWARTLLALLGVEFELVGAPPRGAFLIVANHLSYLDVPVLAALFPGRFVAKSEIASWPVLGRFAALVGTIFVHQKRTRDVLRVEREMTRTLAAGVPVLLFPEGHSTRGVGIDRLHSSLLEGAASQSMPCLAVTLGYETPLDRWAPAATVCWWGGMGFLRHARGLLALRSVRARVRVAEAPRRAGDRKALTALLCADLLAGFVPVRQGPIAPDYPWPELFETRPKEGEALGQM
ncbi:MAG: 1-acyl-sn-glycerol-3-phosphate acyltransferase [Planctomycetes bacterium]|nr:1-acyl-sn-glycerol-3-phosphate acyltransferase [Planctomycetota bacterium]